MAQLLSNPIGKKRGWTTHRIPVLELAFLTFLALLALLTALAGRPLSDIPSIYLGRLRNDDMTTLSVRKPYTDEELRKLYPAGLELQQVQILLRHGERTPVSPRFQNAGLKAFWPYCAAVRHMRNAVMERAKDGKGTAFTTLEWKRRLETFGPDDAPVIATGPTGELDAICDMGECGLPLFLHA